VAGGGNHVAEASMDFILMILKISQQDKVWIILCPALFALQKFSGWKRTNLNCHASVPGIVWFRWRGWDYTLKKAVMMIKPKGIISTTA
jgi:hypothetical protein